MSVRYPPSIARKPPVRFPPRAAMRTDANLSVGKWPEADGQLKGAG